MLAMPTAQELYTSAVRDMPSEERLRLAALILNDLTQPSQGLPDYEDDWTEEDMRDLTTYTLRRAEESDPYEDDRS
jgi:hypothetical protein